jgi:hypothetical protein
MITSNGCFNVAALCGLRTPQYGLVTAVRISNRARHNRRIVLDVIRRYGSLSRKEIVERVALSPQTVANITSI